MKTIICFITTAIILHNLLIGFGDEFPVDDNDLTVVDEENELNAPINNMETNTEARRTQLMNYILENYH